MRQQMRFVTKADCGLCETGLMAVQRVAALFRFEVDVVDVGSSGEYAAYAERLPVVIVDGDIIAEGRIGHRQVVSALTKRRLSKR